MNSAYQIHKWSKYRRMFTDVVALKPNLTIIGEKMGVGVEAPGKFSELCFFHLRKMPFVI